ncbi:uncharacterized protein ASCRUDRAFT_82951 [Ascoidea rubescens DSM 1968]|uniref:Uncharacterized protein n=1 Tax=Ascoidea rubescens DSM 1968 TaxID=1344418 RepID=A0A1D2V9I9_9ASCO|nr:hypothetical protein ASCRUDRAFT_82951 [Ascoidea rubescens DSM 1968]ODV58147.1 hypothetical protein ASCRUDRAFT_82951 [Ascoidea rubescens DSM 1968]
MAVETAQKSHENRENTAEFLECATYEKIIEAKFFGKAPNGCKRLPFSTWFFAVVQNFCIFLTNPWKFKTIFAS